MQTMLGIEAKILILVQVNFYAAPAYPLAPLRLKMHSLTSVTNSTELYHSRPASLDSLPNELLFMIIQYLAPKSNVDHPREGPIFSPRFHILYVIAQLNRRLRAFALPLARIHHHFSSSSKFFRALFVWKGKGCRHLARIE